MFLVVDTVPEFLLKDEDDDEMDDDDIDIDVDPCALSPSSEPLWPLMSSSRENDNLPIVDNILSTFTGKLYCHCHRHFLYLLSQCLECSNHWLTQINLTCLRVHYSRDCGQEWRQSCVGFQWEI